MLKHIPSEWYLLAAICLAMVGYIFNRNLLVPIQDQLMDFYDINNFEYNLLQSLYSWPNAALAVYSGIFVDTIGCNKMLILSYLVLMCGATVMFISSIQKQYILLCISRGIIGVANELLALVSKVLLFTNFQPKQYGVVIGIFLSTIPLSGALNLIITFQLYSWSNSIPQTLSLPLFMNPILSIPLFLYIIKHVYYKKTNDSKVSNKLVPMRTLSETDSNSVGTDIATTTKNKFHFSDIASLSFGYWMLIMSTCAFSVSYHSWNNIKVSFIHHMFGYNYSKSSTLSSINSWSGIGTVLLFGYITDQYGLKCKLMIFACFILCIAYYMLGFVNINIFVTSITLLLVAVGNGSFYAAAWPGIALLVKKKLLGTAYGFLASLRFGCMAIGYLVVGALTKPKDGDTKYVKVQYFTMSLLVVAVIFAIILLKLDHTNGNKLELPTTETKHITSTSTAEAMRNKTSIHMDI